jgi:ubiquitin-conjugating enzyme E2 Z
MSDQPFKGTKRVAKELLELQSRTFIQDSPFFVAPLADRPAEWSVLIVGPPDTPYSGGFFVFSWDFRGNFPFTPPLVRILSTDGGRVRFNPNLYSDGKVCLSMLGTFGNDWSAVITSEKIIESIRGLVMTAVPFYNEPGYERESRVSTAAVVENYTRKIRHEVLRVAVVQAMESLISPSESLLYEPFRFELLALFRVWYRTYRAACFLEQKNENDGSSFTVAPFEFPGNETKGMYNYSTILHRLDRIAQNLAEKDEQWRSRKPVRTVHDDVKELRDELEFHYWHCVFDAASLPADFFGVTITVEVLYDPEHRDKRPTARLVSPRAIFHPLISEDGVLYWFACENLHPKESRYDIRRVLDAIKATLAAPSETSRAVWVNHKAGRLRFSSVEADKLAYQRAVRRSMRASGASLPTRASAQSTTPTFPAKCKREVDEVVDVDHDDC